jgi:hypothetical protein
VSEMFLVFLLQIESSSSNHGPVFYHRTCFTVGADRNTNVDSRCENKMALSHKALQSGSGRKEMKFSTHLISRDAQLRTVRHINPTRRQSLSASVIHIGRIEAEPEHG